MKPFFDLVQDVMDLINAEAVVKLYPVGFKSVNVSEEVLIMLSGFENSSLFSFCRDA